MDNNVKYKEVKVDFIETMMHSPQYLLNAACSEDKKPAYVYASQYADTVEELRNKGFTWKEVGEWFEKMGIPFSIQALISGWRGVYKPINPLI